MSAPVFALNQLRCFVAVADELNFRRAAIRLNMTQPPLTRQIQTLEHALGVILFHRTKRSVRLTAPGHSFLPDALDILKRAEAAARSAQLAGKGEIGSIKLGFLPFTGLEYIPLIVSKMKTEMPEVKLILRELISYEQLDGLAAGMLDLGITRMSKSHDTILHDTIIREPYQLAVHKSHPLAIIDHPRVEHLDGVDFIMYGADVARYSFDVLSGVFTTAGVRPNFVQFVSQPHSFLGLVNAGLGVAVIPASACAMQFENVVFRDIDLLSDIHSEIYLAYGLGASTPLRENVAVLIIEALSAHKHFYSPE